MLNGNNYDGTNRKNVYSTIKFYKKIVDEFIKGKVKNEMKVGMKVNVVQKTKKTPGVITKIMNARCLVDLSGKVYRVPMTMLEAA